MLITGYFLDRDVPAAPKMPSLRHVDLGAEDPAHLHLSVSFNVRQPLARSDNVNVLLMIKNFRRLGDNPMLPPHFQAQRAAAAAAAADATNWTEVHRARVEDTDNFTNLQYALRADHDLELRVIFFRHVLHSDMRAKLCHSDVRLRDVVEHSGTHLDRTAYGPTGECGFVSFGLKYMRQLRDRLILELKVRVERNSLWPFKSSNPFFVVYASDYASDRWLPVYRSEVIQQMSLRCDPAGIMHFAPVVIPSTELRLDDDTGIRIEFFHYKATGYGMLLGYVQTTAIQLRQAKPKSLLPLEVNEFPHSELNGEVKLEKKQITAATTFYSIKAEFGGGKMTDCICLTVEMCNVPRARNFNYVVYRGARRDVMYRSEPARRSKHRTQFNSAFISLKRLRSVDADDALVSVRIYRSVTVGRMQLLCTLERTVAQFLALVDGETIDGTSVSGQPLKVTTTRTTKLEDYGSMTKIGVTFDLSPATTNGVR